MKSFEIIGGNIQSDGSIKVTPSSDLIVKIKVNSQLNAKNLKAALYAKVKFFGSFMWYRAVNKDFGKKVEMKKDKDLDLEFDYHIPFYTPSVS